jgi:hypothetical protein
MFIKEGAMAQFDMRGQKVTGDQYIAGRDMNFGAVQSQADLIGELEKLKGEFAKAADQGILSEEAATDAQYQVTKAVQQARKPDADKKTILDHLDTAKAIIGNVTAASGLVLSVANAIMAVQKLF